MDLRIVLLWVLWGIGQAALAASPTAHAHMHEANSQGTSTPVEAGQGAFAAIAEIVALLEASADTDWSRVDLDLLREHLVDMNEVVLRASAKAHEIGGGVEIQVTGAERTIGAIQRMVPAHALELNRQPGWNAAGEATPLGATLRVTGHDAQTTARIRGLGFFGLLATGAHHQAHHLAIAQGQHMHK